MFLIMVACFSFTITKTDSLLAGKQIIFKMLTILEEILLSAHSIPNLNCYYSFLQVCSMEFAGIKF